VVTLPDDHHYVRYCKPTQIDGNQVLPQAFTLLEKDIDGGVSGDHFEHYNSYKQVLESVSKRLRISKNACFAKLNCGEVINSAKAVCKISFIKKDEKQSHVLMAGLSPGDDVIPALLVTLIKETIRISSICT
jgi:hypothetical protein